MLQTAKIFQTGRSQAVRLPAEFRFDTAEVFIRRDPVTGDVILSRRPQNWEALFDLQAQTELPQDFLTDRQDTPDPRQWGLSRIKAPLAWDKTRGEGVTVAVLDTGLSAHSYLAGHTVPGYDWLGGSPDTTDRADGIDQDGDGAVDEMAGHGTFVAGIIHTAAPQALIMPVPSAGAVR